MLDVGGRSMSGTSLNRLSALGSAGLALFLIVQSVCVGISWTVFSSSSTVLADEPTILRVGMLQGIDSLNPFIAYEDSSYVTLFSMYDRLLSYDEDLKVNANIATSWEVDSWSDADDPLTTGVDEGANRLWRYTIAQDVKWHDGEALTVKDVAYSINVNLNESMWAFTPYISVDTAEYARAINSTTVEVYLKIPNVHVENLMLPIVPFHIWGGYSAGEIQNSVLNDHPIGSGPFKFVEYARDQYVILERNPTYHLGPVAYDRLIFQFYGSDQVMAMDLKNGNLDLARFPPLTYNSLKGQSNIETAEVDRYYQSTIGFNCYETGSKGDPLVKDEHIRRAMHMAIDKTYLIDTIWAGYGDVGYGLPAPIVPFYHWEPETPEESLDFNLTRANSELDQAGYDKWNSDGIRVVNRTDNPFGPMGKPLSFEFMVRNDAPEDIAAAPYIKEMWQEIGISVQIMPIDEGAMETEIMWAASHDVFMWYWSGDFDPTYILGIHTEAQIGGWTDTYWVNETYEELFLLQMQQSGAERQNTVFEMQRIWYESSGMIILAYPYDLFAWNTQYFTNWGDPESHPGRTMTPYFGANPLFLGLQPVGTDEGGGSTVLVIGAGIGAVVVAAVAALVVTRRRRGRSPAEATEAKERKTGLE
jgi:peptide/nickel transport system substrate-binding protein